MVRAPFFDCNGTKKGAWSEEEDNKLRAHITAHGHRNWRLVPRLAGLARCGKSCRLRWMNYLRPGLRRGNFTEQEKDLILKLHDQLGNKWSAIAEHFPGRTDNEVKNYWHARISKHRKRNHGVVNETVRTDSSEPDYGIIGNDQEEDHVNAHENAFQLQDLSVENTQVVDSYSTECDLWNESYETCYNPYFNVKWPSFTEENQLHEFGSWQELMHNDKPTSPDSSNYGINYWYSTEECRGSFWCEAADEGTFDVVLW